MQLSLRRSLKDSGKYYSAEIVKTADWSWRCLYVLIIYRFRRPANVHLFTWKYVEPSLWNVVTHVASSRRSRAVTAGKEMYKKA